MLKISKKFIEIGGKIQLYIASGCMLAIIIAITVGVFSRKVLNAPFNWTEELCTFLFIWLSFCGASVAAKNKKHVSADFLSSKISKKMNEKLQIIMRALMILLLVIMFIAAVILQPKMMGHSSTALNIPKNFYYLPILLASFYMAIVYIVEMVELIIAKRNKFCSEGKESYGD